MSLIRWWGAFGSNSYQIHNKFLTSDIFFLLSKDQTDHYDDQRSMTNCHWSVIIDDQWYSSFRDQWSVINGHWLVIFNCQWSMIMFQWSLISDVIWSVINVSDQWSLTNVIQLLVIIDHWSMVIDQWYLMVNYQSLVINVHSSVIINWQW